MAIIQINVHSNLRTVVTSYSGVMRVQDVFSAWSELKAMPDFDAKFNHLVDLSNVADFRLSYYDQQVLAKEPNPFEESSRLVFVAATDLVFDLVSVYVALIAKSHSHTSVVRSLQEGWFQIAPSGSRK